jgi:hypothetical protein
VSEYEQYYDLNGDGDGGGGGGKGLLILTIHFLFFTNIKVI